MNLLRWMLLIVISLYGISAMAETTLPYAPGQVIVRFIEPTTLDKAHAVLDNKLFTVDRLLVPQLDIYLVKLASGFAVTSALRELEGYAEIKWAQADHYVQSRLMPNDPSFTSQWDMNQVSDADVDAPEAWNITTGGTDPGGNSIVVAIVDGGAQITHTDLAANIWVNSGEVAGNGIDDDGDGYIDDRNGWNAYNNTGTIPTSGSSAGHGTHVSGTVGARGNNSTLVAGENWNVKLMEVAASSSTTSIVSAGYTYVLTQKQRWLNSGGTQGADVVSTNSSFGVDAANCASGDYPIWNDLYNAMGAAGILSAAATANQNWNIDVTGDVPTGCSSPYLIAVTNTTSTDQRNSGAAYGATTVDLGAPGTNIVSTYNNGSTSTLTGTSMATPHVAGAVALMHAAASADFYAYYILHPDSAALLIKQMILDNVDHIQALQGITVSGGRLNLYNAANAIHNYTAPGPPPPNLVYTSHVVNDPTGDNDGLLDPGETADLVVTLTNNGANALNVTGTLSTSDPYVTITDNSGLYGDMAASTSADNAADPFTLTIDSATPLEHVATLSLTLTAVATYQVTRTFDVVIGQKVTYWSDSIETGDNGWTHSNVLGGFGDAWHISTEMYSSPAHAWKCGDQGAGTYPALLDAGLVSPPVVVTAQSTLQFQHWMDSEVSGTYSDSAYDGGVVEIQANNGGFVQVLPVAGYPKHFRTTAGGGNPYTGPMPGAACYAGTTPWSTQTVDLGSYAGDTIQVRFRFGSDNGTGREGWYVDDVQIRGEAPQIICHAPVTTCSEANPSSFEYAQPLTVCANVADVDNDVASVTAHYTTALCEDTVPATFAAGQWCVTIPANCTQTTEPIQVVFVTTDACSLVDSTTCLIAGPTPPDPVIDVVIHPVGSDITLNWTPSTSGANYYVIYRNTDSQFIPEPVDSIGFTTDSTFTDVGISAAALRNFYIIKAVR